MKKIKYLIILLLMSNYSIAGNKIFEPSDILKNMGAGDKAAILMVYFGSTHYETRSLTIDALNERAKKAFPQFEVREAYTSRIVIKRLSERGIDKLNPSEALQKLLQDGYTHIVIQSMTIMDGVEMESLRENVDKLQSQFKEIRISTPLLYYCEDYKYVVKTLAEKYHAAQDMAYLIVGHGTYDVATAQYAMLDYVFKDEGYNNFFVGCIEGYPFYEQVVKKLHDSKPRRVMLIPFMFVAGEHAKNDIAKDWRSKLLQEGFEVNVCFDGIGQLPQIQQRFIDIARFYTRNRRISIMEKKNIYETIGKKMDEEDDNNVKD